MEIRRLTTDDGATYRRTRLQALRTDPDAFASSYDRESAFDDCTWGERLAGFQGRPGAVFIGEHDGVVSGMVGVGQSEVATDAMLWGMWVAPDARGSGLAGALVAATHDWARRQSLSNIVLFVHRTNAAAIAFYERTGFRDASCWQGEQPAECAEERCMSMSIYAATP